MLAACCEYLASSLAETEYRVRCVRFFERGNLFGCKPQRQCGDCVGEMVRLGSAHNRRSDKRFGEHPGKRKLSAGNATLFGELTEAVDHFTVCLFRLRIQRLGKLIRLEPFRALGLPRACQTSTRERTPWNYTNAFGLAERHHLSFFFAIEQIVMILHGNESRPTVAIRKIQRPGELPRVHGRRSDIAN